MRWEGESLGNARTEEGYFLWSYTRSHIPQTSAVTNEVLVSSNQRMLTEQEFFVYVVLELALSLYPSWRLEDLFNKNTTGEYCFCPSPEWSECMSLNCFQLIRSKIWHIPEVLFSYGDSFVVTKPLVDATNKRRVLECLFILGRKLVIDESTCSFYVKACPHTTKI